jgi:hypothetical protein
MSDGFETWCRRTKTDADWFQTTQEIKETKEERPSPPKRPEKNVKVVEFDRGMAREPPAKPGDPPHEGRLHFDNHSPVVCTRIRRTLTLDMDK